MAAYDPYGFRDGRHRRGDASRRLPVIQAGRCHPAESTDCQDREGFKIMIALRVLSCFSAESQTLTSVEIASRLNLPAADVARAATKLTHLNYLIADSTSSKIVWTRTSR
jgi:hypothetical protein